MQPPVVAWWIGWLRVSRYSKSLPMHKDEPGVVKSRRSGKKDAVEPIEDPPVAGNDHPRILDTEASLEEGFEQVTRLSEETEHQRSRQAIDNGKGGKKRGLCDESPHNTPG